MLVTRLLPTTNSLLRVELREYHVVILLSFCFLFPPSFYREKQLAFLENLHPGDGPYFINGDKRCAGGYAIAAALDMLVQLEGPVLEKFPKLKAFYDAMISSPAFDGIRDLPMYFSRSV